MTSVFNKSIEALNSLVDALQQLPAQSSYTNPCEALSNATIGQHTRHIIELYQCLLAGYPAGKIYYDDRKRNPLYENEIPAAIEVIKEIQKKLEQPDKEVNNSTDSGLAVNLKYKV